MERPSTGERIFISHSKADIVAARELCRALESAGFVCWIAPRDIPLGASYPSAIARAIAESDALTVLISNDANASPQVAREVTHAMESCCLLLPICMADAQPQGDLAYLLAGIERYDAGEATQAAFAEIVPRLRLAFTAGNARSARMPVSAAPAVSGRAGAATVLEARPAPPPRAAVEERAAGTDAVRSDGIADALRLADAARKGVIVAAATAVLALVASLVVAR